MIANVGCNRGAQDACNGSFPKKCDSREVPDLPQVIVLRTMPAFCYRSPAGLSQRLDLPTFALHDRATAEDGLGVRAVDCRLNSWLTKASATCAFGAGGLFVGGVPECTV